MYLCVWRDRILQSASSELSTNVFFQRTLSCEILLVLDESYMTEDGGSWEAFWQMTDPAGGIRTR